MSKKTDRKSPAKSATLFAVGTKQKGLDGNMWIIAQASNGVKRWSKVTDTKVKKSSGSKSKKSLKKKSTKIGTKAEIAEKLRKLKTATNTKSFVPKSKATSKGHTYFIHDNGGRPFKVVVNKNGIFIYGQSSDMDGEEDSDGNAIYDKGLLKITNYAGYWVGFDTSKWTSFHGNTILIQLDLHSYVAVVDSIYSFKTSDVIVDYVSPVGNSDVPYPVAYGTDNVYFILDAKKVAKKYLRTDATPRNAEDMYGEFYDMKDKKNKTGLSHYKMLFERNW